MLFCTLARKNQMGNAIIWARSVRYYHPDSVLVLGMLEHTIEPEYLTYFDEAVYVSNHGVPAVTIESSCAARTALVRTLLHRTPQDMLVYMDPETRMYTPFVELHQLLQSQSIVVVPHYLEPCADPAKEAERFQKGMFNTGLLGLRNSPEAKSFANWWAHVVHESFYGPNHDMFSDSRWLDVTMDIHGLYILKDPAYGLTALNLTEPSRSLYIDQEGVKLGDGRWLRCMNFSNPDGLLDRTLHQLEPDRRGALKALIDGYRQEVHDVLPASRPARTRKALRSKLKRSKLPPKGKRRLAGTAKMKRAAIGGRNRSRRSLQRRRKAV